MGTMGINVNVAKVLLGRLGSCCPINIADYHHVVVCHCGETDEVNMTALMMILGVRAALLLWCLFGWNSRQPIAGKMPTIRMAQKAPKSAWKISFLEFTALQLIGRCVVSLPRQRQKSNVLSFGYQHALDFTVSIGTGIGGFF